MTERKSRGIAFHQTPMASDVMDAIAVLLTTPDQVALISFAQIICQMVDNNGDLPPGVRRSLLKQYQRCPHSRMLAGCRLFQEVRGKPTVPVNQFCVSKGIAALYDPEIEAKHCLPIGRERAAGIVVVPKDTHEPILIEWLRRNSAVALGAIDHARQRIEHASSHPSVKLLKAHTERVGGAFQKALPAPAGAPE
jgi:hypothetical protein